MYFQVKSCVRAGDGLTNTFDFQRGVRQGCPLSTILFALFMNDLENNLLQEPEGITLWDTTICSVLYLDDLILLAKSANGFAATNQHSS